MSPFRQQKFMMVGVSSLFVILPLILSLTIIVQSLDPVGKNILRLELLDIYHLYIIFRTLKINTK